MHRALIGDLDQFGLLLGRQWPDYVNLPVDPFKGCILCFAIGTISGMYFRMPQIHDDFLERPPFAPSIHP